MLHHVTRRPILQKVRDRRLTLRSAPLSLLVNIRFQVLFHSPPGVLFTVPSRYYSLSVTRSYLALWDGPHSFTPDSSCPVLLCILLGARPVSTTGLLPSLVELSSSLRLPALLSCRSPNPKQISSLGLGSCNFARHYSRNRLFTFFSSGYLDVSGPRVSLQPSYIFRRR